MPRSSQVGVTVPSLAALTALPLRDLCEIAPLSRGEAAVSDDDELIERLRASTEALEALAADRSLLHRLPEADRVRLLTAAGDVYSPDVEARRRQAKERRRQEKLDKRRREEEVLTETGIRRLRARPVFTTPNVFAPDDFVEEVVDRSEEHTSERQALMRRS